ncbi:IclR family transcriptional regulator [Halomarina halobia]|uniref:IclR family transcriptional regulator n=1 Tax=Halomarina halobia TaxID=3033386 RepID=A0ABD6ACE0_9EURY|nr:helix-turn-helix domain-containing protein [Halomarina sp. PSR21]
MIADERYHVTAIDTAVSILEVLQDRKITGPTEIARTLDVSKANVHKHLVTLHDHGFLRRDGDKYRLGYRFYEFGSTVRNEEPLFQEAIASLQELATIADEVATLLIRDGDVGVYIHSIDPDRDGQPGVKAGTRISLDETASGRAILASLDRVGSDSPVGPSAANGTGRLGSAGEGWIAQTDDETGLREIAAPVTMDDGEPIGAVALFVDAPSVSEQVESNYTKLVKKTAQTVSKRMGIRGGNRRSR